MLRVFALALAIFFAVLPAEALYWTEPYSSYDTAAEAPTSQKPPQHRNLSSTNLDVAIAHLLGSVLGKLYDPLAWLVVVASLLAGALIHSWTRGALAAVAIAGAATVLNVALAWSWWTQLGGPIGPRIGAVSQAIFIIALASWAFARCIRGLLLHDPYPSDPAWTHQQSPAWIERLLTPREPTTVPAWQWRYWVAGSILWVVAALTFVLVFEPFGRYWRDETWFQFLVVLVGPSLIAALALWLLAWAGRNNSVPS